MQLGHERARCTFLQGNNTLSSVSAHRNVDGTYSGTMALRNGGAPAHCHALPVMYSFSATGCLRYRLGACLVDAAMSSLTWLRR